jgi:hypothetical protein
VRYRRGVVLSAEDGGTVVERRLVKTPLGLGKTRKAGEETMGGMTLMHRRPTIVSF